MTHFAATRRLLLLIVSFGLLSCAEGPVALDGPAQVTVDFLTPATVRTIIVEVSGPGLTPPTVLNIPVGPDTVARQTIELTAGASRRIVVSAADTGGVITHRGDTTIALRAGVNPPLAIRLVPLDASMSITVTFGGHRLTVADTSTRRVVVGDTVRIVAEGVTSTGVSVAPDSLVWASTNPALFVVNRGVIFALREGTGEAVVSFRGAAFRVPVRVQAARSVEATLLDGPDFTPTASCTTCGASGTARVALRYADGAREPATGRGLTATASTAGALLSVVGVAGTAGTQVSAISDTAGIVTLNVQLPASNVNGVVTTVDSDSVRVEVLGGSTITFTAARVVRSEGSAHACAVDGRTLACWGNARNGQLGNGIINNASYGSSPVSVAGVSFTPATGRLAPGAFGDHSCLLDDTGAAWCWGYNAAGQLGDGSVTTRTTPVRVETAQRFVQIEVGQNHSCARSASGEVWCWGGNFDGQLGDGTRSTRRRSPIRVALPGAATDLSLGAATSCARVGAWYCWGSGTGGLIGDGASVPRLLPTLAAGGTAFNRLSVGVAHACGIDGSGGLWCWGTSTYGEAGDPAFAVRLIPTQIAAPTVLADVSAGQGHTCATAADGRVWCFGRGDLGQHGDSLALARSATLRVVPAAGRFIWRGSVNGRTCVADPVGRLPVCWGDGATVPQVFGLTGGATSLGAIQGATFRKVTLLANSSTTGQLRVRPSQVRGGSPPGVTVRFEVIAGALTFADGARTATAVTDAAGVSAGLTVLTGAQPGPFLVRASAAAETDSVRYMISGEVGSESSVIGSVVRGGVAEQWIAQQVDLVPPEVIVRNAAGRGVPEALVTFRSRSAGIQRVVTDTAGRAIATNLGAQVDTITAVVEGWVDTTRFVVLTSREGVAQRLSSCAVAANGQAYCWGRNFYGGLGNGVLEASPTTATDMVAPVAVVGAPALVSLGEGQSLHRCGLTAAGQAWCWGLNDVGQLGDGTFTNRAVAAPVSGGLAFVQLATQGMHSCGVTAAGALYCWGGAGGAGYLGAMRGERTNVPVRVDVGSEIVRDIAMTDDTYCIQNAAGQIRCWGRARNGEAGYPTFSGFRTTLSDPILGATFKAGALAGGTWGYCAVRSDGETACWGQNFLGQLGDGTEITPTSPVVLQGGRRFTQVSVGNGTSCGVESDGTAYCWGNNNAGQQGIGPRRQLTPAIPISGVRFSYVRLEGIRHTCGKAVNGMMYCWGGNVPYGAVGDSTRAVTLTDVMVPRAVKWVDAPALGTPVALVSHEGDKQTAAAGQAVTVAPAVRAVDRAGNPVAGVVVTFVIRDGGGVLTAAQATTGADGIARVGSWSLGASGAPLLEATAALLPSVFFTATRTN